MAQVYASKLALWEEEFDKGPGLIVNCCYKS